MSQDPAQAVPTFEFSPAAREAMEDRCRPGERAALMAEARHLSDAPAPVRPELDRLVRALDRDGFVLIKPLPFIEGKDAFAAVCVFLGRLMGDLAVQNAAGATMVEVYDRDQGRMEDGARYHQTRQGGEIHTDSVNHPLPFDYLILGCTAPSTLGGETILVPADDVADRLLPYSDIVATLQQPFWFEGRGMSAEVGHFRVPVMFDRDGHAHFRYLRGYIEAAHRAVGEPLTGERRAAFDVLDALLETSSLQRRVSLGKGDILVTRDTRVFHGRTSFFDRGGVDGWVGHRHMFRLWVREPEAGSHRAAIPRVA